MKQHTFKHSLVLIAGLALAAPVLADPPPWAPAYGHRAHERAAHEYRYLYYRNEVPLYYAPQRGLWFWLSGNRWQVGASLPLQYQRYATGGISIQLNTVRPYEQNAYVVTHYGAPQHSHRRHEDHDGYRHEGRHGHGHD